MFENFVDAEAKPRYRSLWASILIHGFAFVLILAIRLADATRFSFMPTVHAEEIEFISPPPTDRLLVAESHRARLSKVESAYSPAMNDPIHVKEHEGSSLVPVEIPADLILPSEPVDPGSFPSSKPLINNQPGVMPPPPNPVIAKPIESDKTSDNRPPKPPEVELPRLVVQVPPVYPEVARLARIQGTVLLDAVIDEAGKVTNVVVVSGHPMLVEAALECVKHWRYDPAHINGHVIPAPLKIVVRFELKFR